MWLPGVRSDKVSLNLGQLLPWLNRAASTPADYFPPYPNLPQGQTDKLLSSILSLGTTHLLVGDVFASIDKGQDDIAQRWQGEAEARASLAVFAEHFHTATQVNEVQSAPTSRHCHKQRKQTVSVGLQKQLPRKAKDSL